MTESIRKEDRNERQGKKYVGAINEEKRDEKRSGRILEDKERDQKRG